MTKMLTGSIILSAVLTLPAMAAYTGPGVASHVNTAADAMNAKDDTPVELTGYLVQSLGDENYLFRDESGEVKVEIDNKLIRDIEVTSDNKVTLIGQVDDEWKGIEIEIDSIRLVAE
ncbi:NirD/YgiW/YdeI family stress tolerance protein [Shewanella sp. KX20019]|uniref:NirD/YgiW/YdeI family stress tolerance protein n=1 Tax=Shewanella sp. KX20019 TaxID=2803864 RepID=UPI001928D749|nr:NirD/YgiW/YdeI family stress tolerance protein [Shewanella sp. KX20019]QQX80424.1 NirD/YgiW/YdeI family stress tolerance protein [Shewanella sp. KX20019]